MRRIAAILILAGATACQSPAAREQSYADRCAAMGIPPGSEQFLQCRLGIESLDIQRQAERRRGLLGAAAVLQATQPTYWTAPVSPSPSFSTTCNSYGNQTRCSTH